MTRFGAALLGGLLSGCGPSTYFDVSGVAGTISIAPASAYWGGPFIAFFNSPTECIDSWWIKRGPSFETGSESPIETDATVLLLTYEGEEVIVANNSVEGDAPVDARVIEISSGAVTVEKARTGYLDLTEINNRDEAIGTLELGFEEGTITGGFQVEWCNNLKSRT